MAHTSYLSEMDRKLVEVWCDGSFRWKPQGTGTLYTRTRSIAQGMGAGIVTQYPNTPLQERAIPLPPYRGRIGARIAELEAFVLAIADIESHAQVRVHMDCKEVLEWLIEGEVRERAHNNTPRIGAAFSQAMHHAERIDEINLIHISDKEAANLRRAHALSRQASKHSEHARKQDTSLTTHPF